MSDVETLLEEIAGIGATEHGGVRRLAWTDEDARLAQWFAAACAERGLEVSTDRCGNQWAWWGDPDAEIAPVEPADAVETVEPADAVETVETVDDGDAVEGEETAGTAGEGEGVEPGEADAGDGTLPYGGVVTGSHLDSVPDGGAFDGPLGVVTALAAVDELKARGFTPRRAIGVVRFVDEEGAPVRRPLRRQPPAHRAARARGRARAASDDDGVTYAEAAAKAGLDVDAVGRDDEALRRMGAFVEVHVEQGFTLAAEEVDSPLGVCGLIRPHGRWRVELHGRGDHAGTARFADRDDPMLELARLITHGPRRRQPAGRARRRSARWRSRPNVRQRRSRRRRRLGRHPGRHARPGPVRRLRDEGGRFRPRAGVVDAGDAVRRTAYGPGRPSGRGRPRHRPAPRARHRCRSRRRRARHGGRTRSDDLRPEPLGRLARAPRRRCGRRTRALGVRSLAAVLADLCG